MLLKVTLTANPVTKSPATRAVPVDDSVAETLQRTRGVSVLDVYAADSRALTTVVLRGGK
jgi:hypothetical protein